MSIWDIFFPAGRGVCMAAFIGTSVFLLNGKKRDGRAIVTGVLVNYLISVYSTGVVAEMANLKSVEGIAFFIGLGGFTFIEKAIAQLINRITTNPTNDGSIDSTT